VSSFAGVKSEELKIKNYQAPSHSSFFTNLSHLLLYHVGWAKGNEPTSREDDYRQVVQHAEKGEEELRQEIEGIEDVQDRSEQNRFGAQRDPPVGKQSPIELNEIRQMPK